MDTSPKQYAEQNNLGKERIHTLHLHLYKGL